MENNKKKSSVCIFLYVISYLYSSVVEVSCHFLFHGCGLLAEMPFTSVLFGNKCGKDTEDGAVVCHFEAHLFIIT